MRLRNSHSSNTSGAGNQEFPAGPIVPRVLRGTGSQRAPRQSPVHTEAQRGDGSPATRFAPPALLTIPRIPASVPASYLLDRGGADSATIAEALIEAKILKPSDWKGELSESISAGLWRWANEDMGARKMKHIDLTLQYSNDPYSIVNQEDDSETFRGEGKGAFALSLTNFDNVAAQPIGERVEALNEIRSGLGWAVLAELDRALDLSIGGCTPSWARDMLSMWAHGTDAWNELGEEPDEDDDSPAYHAGGIYGPGEIITIKQFDTAVPPFATNLKPDPELLESLWYEMRDDPDCFPEWARFAVAEALHLGYALDDARRSLTPGGTLHGLCTLHHYDKHPMKPVLLWWNQQDAIGAIFDDYHNENYEDGSLTNTLWLKEFPLSQPGEVLRSAHALRFVVATAVCCDSLIDLLAGPVSAPVQVFTEIPL